MSRRIKTSRTGWISQRWSDFQSRVLGGGFDTLDRLRKAFTTETQRH
jgi:hypothetical protein